MSSSMDSVDKMHPSTVFPLNNGWRYKHICSVAFTYHKKGGEGNGQELSAGSSEGIFPGVGRKRVGGTSGGMREADGNGKVDFMNYPFR